MMTKLVYSMIASLNQWIAILTITVQHDYSLLVGLRE